MTTPVPVPDPSEPLADPTDPTTFSKRKLEHLRWEREDLAPGVLALAQCSLDNAEDSEEWAQDAAVEAAAAASASAVATSAANFVGSWASLTGALTVPASVYHNGALWTLLNNLANVTTSQPGVTADWVVVGGAFPITMISTNTTAVAGNTYAFTAACTLTLPAISGNGKQVGVIVMAGVAGAVVAPAGSDKIRSTAGNMDVDIVPWDHILTDKGATYGWM